jgi:hypothetical protein
MINWTEYAKEKPVKNDIYVVFHNEQIKTSFFSEKGFAVEIIHGGNVSHWSKANKPILSQQ